MQPCWNAYAGGGLYLSAARMSHNETGRRFGDPMPCFPCSRQSILQTVQVVLGQIVVEDLGRVDTTLAPFFGNRYHLE